MEKSFKNQSQKKSKPTRLEMADQMFKDAFLIKKTRFSHLHPNLTEKELTKMTADYFRNLNEESR